MKKLVVTFRKLSFPSKNFENDLHGKWVGGKNNFQILEKKVYKW